MDLLKSADHNVIVPDEYAGHVVQDIFRWIKNGMSLDAMGVRFVAITDNYDSSKKDADLMVAVTNIANDLYAKDISRIENITTAYNENSPEFIYFMTLYHVFSEFLDDISEDELPNEATGFKHSKIWNMLYNFQKDAVLAIINKLERYNGCILADSVGLGKTFTALAVVKYYENRNKSVLVLCPKKLAEKGKSCIIQAVGVFRN